MYLIRQLATKYNLTRTALLHYDSIGLLTPSARTEAGYRLYSAEDEKRLQKILLYRSMGMSLDDIQELLKDDESKLANALLIRLGELNQEIADLKNRQQNIMVMFRKVKNVEEFLKREGNDDHIRLLDGIHPLEWHELFEAVSPNLHQEFLEILDLIPEELKGSIQASLDALPEKERDRLNQILQKR